MLISLLVRKMSFTWIESFFNICSVALRQQVEINVPQTKKNPPVTCTARANLVGHGLYASKKCGHSMGDCGWHGHIIQGALATWGPRRAAVRARMRADGQARADVGRCGLMRVGRCRCKQMHVHQQLHLSPLRVVPSLIIKECDVTLERT